MERLDKILAEQKSLSRKEVKALVRAGRVKVNGKTALDSGLKISRENDEVLLDGSPVSTRQFSYLMLNKPAGVLSATRDPKTPTVLDLVPPEYKRKGLFPAGRLDKDTEGLLILTNDGAFAHRILSPKNHVPKTYLARLDRTVYDAAGLAEAFGQGVDLGGEDRSSPAQLRLLEAGETPLFELTIYEGIYHQVKRMFGCFSYEVIGLKRIKMGNLELDPQLLPGVCRPILHKELFTMY